MPCVNVQVLAASSTEHTPSVMLFVDGNRYLFNVGEGLQRFCMEHHVKLSRVKCIFLSGLNSIYTGGLPGMLMTMSDAGTTNATICGPPGTGYFFVSTKYFFRRSNLDLNVFECCRKSNSTQVSTYNDNIINVKAITLRKHTTSNLNCKEKQTEDTINSRNKNKSNEKNSDDKASQASTESIATTTDTGTSSVNLTNNYLSN